VYLNKQSIQTFYSVFLV